jgi:hypothetical protein
MDEAVKSHKAVVNLAHRSSRPYLPYTLGSFMKHESDCKNNSVFLYSCEIAIITMLIKVLVWR